MGKLGFWFWVLCGELMKWSFENENWRSNGWIMSWMIDFGKRMSERWRNLREKWRGTVHPWEIMMKWSRTSEEIMMEKCLMKMKCMGISLNGWFGHENGWKWTWKWMGCSRFWERKRNMCRKLTKEEEEAKKTICQTRDQAASRLLSGWGDISKAAVQLHLSWFPANFNQFRDHFVIPKHLKSQFNAWFMILNIQKIINSNK